MIYITTRQQKVEKQLTWLDILYDNEPSATSKEISKSGTITRCVNQPNKETLKSINIERMIGQLKAFNEKYSKLLEADKKSLYKHFTIPKRSGGVRPIDAPVSELQQALGELKDLLCEKFGLLYHTSAFAYVPGRCIVDEVKKHQANESNWFLKTDFSGFFPSTNLDFVMKMMEMIFPTSEICKTQEGKWELRKALSLGFLNGGLPQGTVLSP